MIFSLALITVMFYVPLITVTYELRLRDIYKNSFILLAGKLWRSLCALILVAVASFAFYMFMDFSDTV